MGTPDMDWAWGTLLLLSIPPSSSALLEDPLDNHVDNSVDATAQDKDDEDIAKLSDNEEEDDEPPASPAPDIWSWGLHPLGLGYVPHVRKRQRLYLRKSSGQVAL